MPNAYRTPGTYPLSRALHILHEIHLFPMKRHYIFTDLDRTMLNNTGKNRTAHAVPSVIAFDRAAAAFLNEGRSKVFDIRTASWVFNGKSSRNIDRIMS
jgi:hypothetical protein